MKQPDRFARVIGRHRWIARDGMGYIVLEGTATHLMRLEHRAVVRLVKQQIAIREAEIRWIDDGHCDRDLNRPAEVHAIQREMQGLKDILAALAKRAR